MKQYAPDLVLTSSIWNWEAITVPAVQKVLDGTWTNYEYYWGMAEDAIRLGELNPVIPAEVRALITDYYERIKAGDVTAHPFYGEVRDKTGKVRLPAGVDATLADLRAMTYRVEGVIDEADRFDYSK